MKDNLYMVSCFEPLYYFSSNNSERLDEAENKRYKRIKRTLMRLNETGTTEDNCFGSRSVVCNPFCNFVRLTNIELEQYKQYLSDDRITFTRLE
jgi:predicted metal-binding transcription factor (methanogenesis marker protein 9)